MEQHMATEVNMLKRIETNAMSSAVFPPSVSEILMSNGLPLWGLRPALPDADLALFSWGEPKGHATEQWKAAYNWSISHRSQGLHALASCSRSLPTYWPTIVRFCIIIIIVAVVIHHNTMYKMLTIETCEKLRIHQSSSIKMRGGKAQRCIRRH